ncbi:UBR3 [Cordylochernes scorpioides]|uniref:E3 ubiquitin-protein ligase n=1 Tax=Cordylochernes scorpioides TaxID=51811 RepID=A0ABY6LDR1_9ARAC|nr:UBR3 [Cordylochernes scorpioides]
MEPEAFALDNTDPESEMDLGTPSLCSHNVHYLGCVKLLLWVHVNFLQGCDHCLDKRICGEVSASGVSSRGVKAFDTATTCGLVWTANFVAYRCRTCGISPCMSLCAECFQKGNHDGHDFNMFRSQAGGACDCGDTSVMRASGFCPKHGPRSKMSLPEVPPSLLNMARFIAPRLILRLIQHFRDSHQNPPPAPPDETQSAGAEANSSTTAAEYISMLQRLLEMGTAMHQVMTSALTSPEVYAELVVQPTAKAIHPDTPRSQRNSYHQRSHQLYMEAKKSLPPCQAPQKFQVDRPRPVRTPATVSKVKRLATTENPPSQRQPSRMCGTSLKTINNIIHKDLELDTRRKGKVHKLTPFHMKNRATNARKLYEEHLAGSRSEYTATLDEAWMYVTYCNGIRKICYIKRGNQVPDNWVHQCSETFPKGFMVVGVMTGRGVLPLIKVPSKVKVNSEFYIECVLKPVIEQLKDLYPGEMDKVFLHHDKASSHTSNKTQQFIQEMKDTLGLNFIRNSDIPVKSPDASPLDFYGFGMLKQRLFNRRPKTEAGLWKAAQEEWSNVSLSKVKEVFAAWKVRCREIAKKKGKHIEHMKKIHVRKIKLMLGFKIIAIDPCLVACDYLVFPFRILHVVQAMIIMQFDFALTNARAPFGLAPLDPNLEHKTFLDELMFWTVKLEFPQDLVCFLLTMLLDQTYKAMIAGLCSLYWGWVLFEQEEFMRTFVLHYGRISVMLSRSANAEPLSHRVVHVSVQLFSNEELAVRMVRDPELRLLHIMVVALKEMVTNILQPSTLHTEKLETNNLHLVADCSHRIMQTHCYWPLVSDLNNLLIHHQVAMDFLQPDYEDLIESWLAFVSMFQYMHLNQRELALHLEFEPKSYYAAFSAELEASATPMWSLISHLQGPEHLCVTRRLIKHCLTALEEWLESIDFAENDKPNRYQMSFHLPLHRNYAMFICQAVLNQGASLPNVLPPPETMKLIIMHPLHTLATFYEIMNALWVRNGVQIRGQSMTYIQCHFCNSMVDADIFLLQLSCGWVDSDWFLETFVDQFHLLEWFSMETEGPRFLEGDQVGPMLEGCLTLLALVCSLHNYLGLREEEVTAREMVAGLCMADRTHSQLLDILPEKCGTSLANQPPNFETVLQQVASYKAPNFEAGGNMLQGTYVPKPHVWEQLYDPIHVSLRAVHRKDQQASMDRFTHYVKQSGKVDCQGNLWPPYRVPGPLPNSQFRDPRIVLHTRTMHAMIFILLYRALNEQDISENTVSLTVHLLDMAVRHTVPRPGQTNKEEVPDLRFQEWYPTDNILENAFIPINSIALPTTSSSPDQAMEVDQAELTRLEVKESIVSLLLKLHSKYSGKPDSFRISRDDRECLMGDGAHFIGRLLNHLAVMCGEQSVLAVQQHIWPWRSPEEDLEDRKKLTENRRRLAKECQKKVLAEMKMQQRVFMQAMETEMGDLEEASASAKEYECVICGHPSPSTTERPIGMVVLIQATSTLGHARQQTPLPLPCSEQELASVDQRRTRAVAVEQAILKLQWNFEDTWQLGLNVGWRGGVHIQSCGHHLHMDCHRSYLDSLRNRISASQQQNSAVDWGEYSCPFCRQLANSVLPLAMEQPPPPTLDEELPVWKIYRLLSAAPQPAKVSDAFGNITSFMENVTNSTSAQSRHYIPEPTHTSLFLFISSLAR